MKYLIVFIPVLMAMSLAIRDQFNRKNIVGTMLLVITSILIGIRFCTLAYFFDGGTHNIILDVAEQLASLFIIPVTYMFLSDQCGTRWNNREAIAMLILPMLWLMGWYPQLEYIDLRDWIVIAQCLIIAFCMARLGKRIHTYRFSFGRQLKIYFIWMAVLLPYTILTFALNMDRSTNETNHWVFFILYTILMTTGYLTVPYSFNIKTASVATEATAARKDATETVTNEVFAGETHEEEVHEEEVHEEEVHEEEVHEEEVHEEEVHEEEAQLDDTVVSQANSHLIEALHKLMEIDLYYLNPNASIDDMAQRLGTNRTYVTRLMRQENGLSFLEYVNVARVQYSQKLLYNSPQMTLEEASMKSGFQSTSSYCRAFKRYTGHTPKGWLQTIHIE